jgi:adenylate kinase family enzyme
MGDPDRVRRVVVLGRGGAGKTTMSARLSRLSGIPVVELDKHFWSPDLTPLDHVAWAAVQRELAAADRWIMDGDLGPYDVLAPRLARADTILLLDFPVLRCVWNAARRSPERADFWWWVLTWRLRHRRRILDQIRRHAPQAQCVILRGPRDVTTFLAVLSEGR